MESCIQEISMADLKEMGDQQVYDHMAYLQELEDQIRTEQNRCRERLGIAPKRAIPEKCESCSSTNIEARVKGGYFCKACGYRSGLI